MGNEKTQYFLIKGPLRAGFSWNKKVAPDKTFQIQNNLTPVLQCFVVD